MEEQEIVCVYLCVCGGQGPLEVAFGEPDQRHSLGTCSLFEADPLAEGFRHSPQQETALAHLLCTQGCREVGEEQPLQKNPQQVFSTSYWRADFELPHTSELIKILSRICLSVVSCVYSQLPRSTVFLSPLSIHSLQHFPLALSSRNDLPVALHAHHTAFCRRSFAPVTPSHRNALPNFLYLVDS